ncbi:protein of unknown function [Maridesulfovibrio hydrothermalis AM13 = DSM 14728]|uniref:Uncharacterized protein n=1 Tax=Maridesulfovibrio hydrothermalis AM13 = DSM 14728 TaxID=1121451 RepID=L0RAT9_9BACT|nr:protein of unknown function [Maridesulfovibrio hydrothermalis AM13 = DSM 14728]
MQCNSKICFYSPEDKDALHENEAHAAEKGSGKNGAGNGSNGIQ